MCLNCSQKKVFDRREDSSPHFEVWNAICTLFCSITDLTGLESYSDMEYKCCLIFWPSHTCRCTVGMVHLTNRQGLYNVNGLYCSISYSASLFHPSSTHCTLATTIQLHLATLLMLKSTARSRNTASMQMQERMSSFHHISKYMVTETI